MSLRTIPLDQLQLADLDRLRLDGVRETKTLDYKQALPESDAKGKFKFLVDVASLANTAGGDIVYGIAEARDAEGHPMGIPEAIAGVAVGNWDQERLRLQQLILNGMTPHIQGLEIEKIDLEPGKAVVIIRVPASLQAPHMITFQQTPAFYTRHDGGNHPMDIDEIQQAFLRSTTLLERAAAFRQTRIAGVLAGETPLALKPGPKMFLHVIPLTTKAFAVDISRQDVREMLFRLATFAGGINSRVNYDGVVLSPPILDRGESEVDEYVQVFRDGTVELCNTWVFTRPLPDYPGLPYLTAADFEDKLMRVLGATLGVFEQLSIALPAVVFLSLTGVKGYTINPGPRFRSVNSQTIHLAQLYPAGQLIERGEQQPAQILKPLLDTIWNAAGFPSSYGYDDQGAWSRSRYF